MCILVYIGAGTDVSILKAKIDTVNLYVFVDSQPKSEFGKVATSNEDQIPFKKKFKKQLKKNMKTAGFRKIKKLVFGEDKKCSPGLIIFASKSGKTVYYFYNTLYPTVDSLLLDFIKSCEYLFVSGHEPEDNIISRIENNITFIGGTNTIFSVDDHGGLFSFMAESKNKVVNWFELNNTTSILTKVSYEHFFCK